MVRTSKDLTGVIMGAIFAILAIVILLLIVGTSSMVALINSALSGICNSGWPLASLFNPSNGIVPLLIVVGLFIAIVIGAFAIGGSMKTGQK